LQPCRVRSPVELLSHCGSSESARWDRLPDDRVSTQFTADSVTSG